MDTNIRILRITHVEEKSGLKRDSIYRLAKLGQFPKPVKISEWASGWVESEIDTYLATRIAERDAVAGTPGTPAKPPKNSGFTKRRSKA